MQVYRKTKCDEEVIVEIEQTDEKGDSQHMNDNQGNAFFYLFLFSSLYANSILNCLYWLASITLTPTS